MLSLQDVSVTFNEGTSLEKRALSHVSVDVNDGDFITILGSNGAGKSTFKAFNRCGISLSLM